MIKVYYIEDLSIEEVDAMIEKGEVFDVVSKAALLQSDGTGERDAFWGAGNRLPDSVRETGA